MDFKGFKGILTDLKGFGIFRDFKAFQEILRDQLCLTLLNFV